VTTTAEHIAQDRRAGLSEFGVAGLLAALGALVLYESTQISTSLAGNNPLGPKTVPVAVGILLLVTSGLLALDVARGGRGEAEHGEDVDLSHGTDWITLAALVAVFIAAGQLIPRIGLPASGAILFFGVSRLLGSHRLWLDVLVSVAIPVAAFYLFTRGLGVSLPGGFL
jgi:putative tricarboxylic transport membrane protein